MQQRQMLGLGACVLVAGCGTLLDIQPDSPPPAADGGAPSSEGGQGDGGAAAGDAADAAPGATACDVPMPTAACILAKNLASLGSIAVGGGYVYFARHEASGAILRVPVTGGAVAPFSGSNSPAGLFATATDLYWVTEGDQLIAHQPFAATMSQASTNGAGTTAAQIAVFGPNAFWTVPGVDANAGQVRKGPADTLTPGNTLVMSQTLPTAVAADAGYVYFATKTTTGHVVRIMSGGTDMTTSADAFDGIGAIALSGAGTVAITSVDGVYRASTTNDATFQAPWTKVSATKTAVGVVAATSGTLYVLDSDGTLEVISNAASPSITRPSTAGCTGGRSIALDGAFVYLACADTIVRVSIAD